MRLLEHSIEKTKSVEAGEALPVSGWSASGDAKAREAVRLHVERDVLGGALQRRWA